MAFAEREFMQNSQHMRPFISVSLGLGIIDVPDVVVPLQDGAEADITTDAGMEIIPGITAGIRFLLRKQLFVESALRYNYHFAEWDVTDRNTRRSTNVDDYTTWGGYIGMGWNFSMTANNGWINVNAYC